MNDDIMSLLCAGIGIYSHRTKLLDKPYLDMVYSLALSGQLAYIVSDDALCFGINIPVNNIIILNDFAHVNNIYTIGQLAGRAGRVGKSLFAKLFMGQVGIQKLTEHANNYDTGDNIELENMLEVFNDVNS